MQKNEHLLYTLENLNLKCFNKCKRIFNELPFLIVSFFTLLNSALRRSNKVFYKHDVIFFFGKTIEFLESYPFQSHIIDF